MSSPDARDAPVRSPRRRGLLLIVGGLVVGGALFVGLIALSKLGVIKPSVSERIVNGMTVRRTSYPMFWGIPAIVPLFTTLLGLIQVVTGRSLTQLGAAYETMTGGKKFVVSALVIALAVAVIMVLAAIAIAIML
jgi:hypothetical protein